MLKSKLFCSLSVAFALSVGAWASEGVHWDYSEDKGPKHWGDLDKQFALCKVGKAQTPIDIITSKAKKTKQDVAFAYANNTKDIVNNGHTIQVNVDGGASSITFNGVVYELVQFHFHTPSENQIDGVKFPLEAHFVHKNDKGNLLVVGVLFNEGAENKAFEKVFKNLPQAAGKSKKLEKVDISALLPESKAYYEFMGSLTTPPCSENVQWVVLKTQLEASKKQIGSLEAILHNNARDIQPLGKRVVKVSE